MNLQTEYLKLRAHGWRAAQALRAARTRLAWDALDGDFYGEDNRYADLAPGDGVYASPGPVRIRIAPDEICDFDELCGDSYNPIANPDIPASRLARERQQELDRVNRDGVWGMIGEYWDGDDWQLVDSCWGFVGDDFKESGYAEDIMAETLRAYDAHNARTARKLEATRPDMYATAN